MKRSRSSHVLPAVALLVLALALLIYPSVDISAAHDPLRAAWDRALESGSYSFSADIVQTTTPLPRATNVGRQSRQDALHIEGETNLPEQSLSFTLWSEGGAILNSSGGVQVRVDEDRALVRRGDTGTWQEANDFTGLFAPDGDFMAYLVSAKDVVAQGADVRTGVHFERYTFRVDGRSYATHMRDQIERDMAEQGELTPGTELGLPRAYVDMTGEGELWIGEDGLPLRQILNLQFPDTGEDQVAAEVDVAFADFGPGGAAMSGPFLPRRLLQEVSIFAACIGCVLVFVSFRRSRTLYTALVLAVVCSLVVTPVLQGVRAAELGERDASRAQEQEENERARETLLALEEIITGESASSGPSGPEALALLDADDGADWDRDGLTDAQEAVLGTNPRLADSEDLRASLSPASAGRDSGLDSDGDGLTDYQEEMLGTSPYSQDTDGDTIDDSVEVAGFVFTDTFGIATHFYTDPLEMDSNDDGVDDGREWYLGTEDDGLPDDTDLDGVPDLFDRDNDSDGVPDDLDISPFQTTTPTLTFDEANPFSLVIDNLTEGEPTYVEFQLRPTDPRHLWYAFNVLDWPFDSQGQVQDGDGATFHDVDPTDNRYPNDNGDIKLLPMLEIRISGSPDNLPSTDMLQDRYNIFVQDLQEDGSERAVYVPLQLATEDAGGARVAFYGKMVYLPAATWGSAHSVRLAWAVQTMVDSCGEYEDGLCTDYPEDDRNQIQIVHTYYDEWYLTGLNVREDHGTQAGVIWEDPAVDDDLNSDDSLVLLTQQLDYTFFSGRDLDSDGEPDITVGELYRRFNNSTNAGVSLEERWGISNTLSVVTEAFDHQDEAFYTLGVTTTKTVLDDHFEGPWIAEGPITPTLLFVREDHYRSTNLDVLDYGDGFSWGGDGGRQLEVDLGVLDSETGLSVTTMAGAKWMPYCRVAGEWEPCDIEDYWAELSRRLDGSFAGESDPDVVQGYIAFFQYYYLGLYSGVTRVVQMGNSVVQSSFAIPELSGDAELAGKITSNPLAATAAIYVVEELVSWLATATRNVRAVAKFFGNVVGSTSTLSVTDIDSGLLTQIKNLRRNFSTWRQGTGSLSKLVISGAALVSVASLAIGTALLIASYVSGSEELYIAGSVMVGAGLFVMQVLMPLHTAYKLYQAARQTQTAVSAVKSVMGQSSAALGATKAAAVIGLVISIGIALGFFIYQMAEGGMNSIQVSMVIAQFIAQTIVAVIYFVLSFTVVGTIIVGILSFFDLIMSVIGLSEYSVAGLLAQYLYGYASIAEPGVSVADLDTMLVDPSGGMVHNARLVVTATLDTTATHDDPTDPRPFIYLPTLWTERILRSTTVRTSLGTVAETLSASRGDMSARWNVVHDHTYSGHNMRRAEVVDTRSTVVTLKAGINVTRTVYLNVGYDMPIASCWMGIPIPPLWIPLIPICYDDSVEDGYSSDIGGSLVLDVFPSTLDEFYWWDQLGTQSDRDGDGLLSTAVGGNDPDDTTWDTDGDGLSDYYEVERRSRGGGEGGVRPSPTSSDTDGDGLCDDQEIRLGTFPQIRDTDGDGLKDGEEVFHLNCRTGEWEGGWDFGVTSVVTVSPGVTTTTTIHTHVSSNPLSTDDDYDGLDDKAEHTLETNPNAWTPSPVAIHAEIDDEDGFVAPGQTVAYTATVENHIDLNPGMFVLGPLTATLPGPMGGGVATSTYNLYQEETASMALSLTVAGGSSSQPMTITADTVATMHDGDLETYWRWDPQQAYVNEVSVSGATAANIAATVLPTGMEPFAVASAEGAGTVGYRLTNADLPGSTAGVRSDSRPGPGLISDAPGIACADSGECLTVWANTHYHNCTELHVKRMYCTIENDGEGDANELRIEVGGTDHWSRYWGGVDLDETRQIDAVIPFCNSGWIGAWEEDDWSGDDHLGTFNFDYYNWLPYDSGGRPSFWTQTMCINHAPPEYYHATHFAEYWYAGICVYTWIHLKEWHGIYGTVLGPTGSIAEPQFNISAQGPEYVLRRQPTVASDGTDFLVLWQESVAASSDDWAVYAQRVNGDGTLPTGAVRVDHLGVPDDVLPSLTWAEDVQYYVASWVENTYGALSFLVAVLDRNGNRVGSAQVPYPSIANPPTGGAQLAYNDSTGELLMVYASNQPQNGVRGRILDVQGTAVSSIGPEITFGGAGVGTLRYPDVAYEPRYGGWMASWVQGTGSVHYAALGADGQVLMDKDGRGPAATHSPTVGSIPNSFDLTNQAAACSYQQTAAAGSDFAQCDIAYSRNGMVYLSSPQLEPISPWFGTISTNTHTLLSIDADPPTSMLSSLSNGQHYAFTGTLIIGGEARESGVISSGIAGVEISIDSGPYTATYGADSWAYAWDVPASDGSVEIRTRATDLVGNVEQSPPLTTVYLDRTPPNVTITDNGVISGTRSGARWRLGLEGTSVDPGGLSASGTDLVEIILTPNGNGWQTATLNGGSWTLDYLMSAIDTEGEGLTDPTGIYTVSARATDAVGNRSGPVNLVLNVDNRPPVANVTDTGPSTTVITSTLNVGGVITDPGVVASGLQALEVSFTPTDQAPTSWLPAALASSGPGVTVTTWTRAVPTDLEGSYQIDLRGTDWIGNRSDDRSPEVWQGEIDTLDPRVAITLTYRGVGAAAQTVYQGWAQDLNLTRDGFQFACPLQAVDRGFYAETWWTGPTSNTQRLHTVDPECIQNGHEVTTQTLRAYDLRGEYGEDTVGPPAGYVPPAVASTVLTPSHEGVLTTADPTSITVGAYALNNLRALTFTVGGSGVISSTTWPCAPVTDTVTNALWSPLWDPPGEGRYGLLTVADDCNGTVQSELQPITVTVDTQPPHIGPPPTVITTAHRLSLNRVVLTGVATDSVGLEDVELAASPWEEAAFDGATYRFPWYLGDEPDNQTYTLTLRATDGASRTDQISTVVTVDLVPPAPVSMTLAYNAGAGDVGLQSWETVRHANPTLAVTWTASSDGSGLGDYLVGWTDEPVPTLATLDPYVLAGSHQESVVEPGALYAHIVSQDIHGNRRLQTVGPVYVDGQTTPDYVSDLDYHGWMESGCTQIGADYELFHNAYSGGSLDDVQRMYLSWDDQALRMTWTGANWNSDGDLFIYLDTDGGVGGTTQAYNPYVDVTPVITLPAQGGAQLVANYVIAVEDSAYASLLAWSGGWVVISPTIDTAHFQLDTGMNPVHTDLLIPWSLLGSPTSLGLVALASEEDSLRVWAAIPDKNPLNSDRVVDAFAYDYLDEGFGLTQQYERGTLGAGACPNLGQFADADLQVSLTADPPGVEVGFLQHDVASLLSPGQPLDGGTMDGEPDVQLPMDARSVLLGDGQTVVYTLVYTNVGAVAAPGGTATVSARGGIELVDGSPQVIPLDQPGETIYITGTVNAAFDGESAEVIATIADTAHSDFEWLWVQHGVDTAPPENLEIQTPAAYANALSNVVAGVVEDPSGVPTITLEVQSVPTGTVLTVFDCIDPTPNDGMWSCVWNAGGAPDGTEFDLAVMASDRFGNISGWTLAHRVTVDSTPPVLFLSLNTESAVGDGLIGPDEVGLSGRVEDDRQAEAALVCAALLGEADQQCLVYDGVLSTTVTIADWNGYVPVLGDGDGVWQTFEFYGLDSVGNRSLVPVTRTAQVDVEAPAVTVTTAVTGVMQAVTATVLAGTVGDGMVVDWLAVHAAGPDGTARWEDLGFTGGAWSYTDHFDLPGAYRLGLEVEDVAGNHRTVGPFRLTVYKAEDVADLSLEHSVSSDPIVTGGPVTYTYDIYNAGPAEAPTSTLTISPPAVASLLSAPLGCNQVGADIVCDLGDIISDTWISLDIGLHVPLTATGYFLSAASVESSKVDLDMLDNRPTDLFTRVAQPITGLAATSDGPTVLGQVTTITASMASGTGVVFDWSLGDGDGAISYGAYETGARSVVSHTYADVGVYTVSVTATNEINVVTATTVVTTDIPVATPLLYEDFEGNFAPQDWLATEWLADHEWRQTSSHTHSGSYSAFYDDLFGEQDGWLVTPQVTPTLGSELVFWQYQNYGFYYGRHSIQASLGSCDPKDGDFVELVELGPGTEDTWEEIRLGLDQFAGLPVCLAFRYEGDWDDEWYVDDVQVTVELVLTHDGPTPLGQTTTMTASIVTGSNVAFDWALGGGQMGSGGVVSHTFPSAGYNTVVVTASNSVSAITASMTVPVWTYIHLPLISRGYRPSCLDNFEVDNNPSLARTIATDGTPQRHTFYPSGDEDWLAFEVVDPDVGYVIETFDLTGSDTVIYLYDSDGVTLLDWNDEPSPTTWASRLEFDPFHAGTFYVMVVNYYPDVAGCGIGYSVRITAQP